MTTGLATKTACRDSNMELARIISMLLITVGHFVLAFGLFSTKSGAVISSHDISSITTFIPHIALYSLCLVGVNLFILISGYYQIKLTWKRLFHFVVLCVFYNALVFLANWLVNNSFSIEKLIKVFIVSKTVNWFFPAYFWLMLASPIINYGTNSLNIYNLRRVVLILFLLNCISGFLFHNQNSNGFNAFQFFFMYIIGSWIRKDSSVCSKNKSIYICLYLMACTVLFVIAICLLAFTNRSLNDLFSFNNPLTVIAATSLFVFFTKVSFTSRRINLLASTVVAALFVQHIMFLTFSPYIHSHPTYFTPLYIIAIFLIAFVIEYPRKQLTEIILRYLSSKKYGAFISRPIISDTPKIV